MTEPLVPPEVDLRDYDYMPLYGDRLFNSDTWALCDADEKVAALRLWWRAWHEEPAGSLPDNDRLLAERAGYGVAVKAFLAIKENVMRGWTKCSDGRLYHPVVASIALEVWGTKNKKKIENAADRERKRLKRLAGSPPDNPEIPPDIPPDKSASPSDVQPENALKGRERKNDANASSAIAPLIDPIKEIFDRGLVILGGDTPAHRKLLGKLRQSYGDVIVLGAIVECENEMPSDPAGYLVACCQRRKNDGRSSGHAAALDVLARAAIDHDERQGYRSDFETPH